MRVGRRRRPGPQKGRSVVRETAQHRVSRGQSRVVYLDKQIVNRAEPKGSNPARGGRLRIRQKVGRGVRLGGLHEGSERALKRFP